MPNCTDLKSVLPEWTVHLDDACDAKNSPFERPIEFPLYSSYSFAFLPFLDESHYELITIVKNLDSSKHCSEAPSNSTSSWVKYVSYWFPLDPCSLSQWLGGGCQVQAMAKQYKWGTSFSIIVVLCEDMLLMDFSGNILSNSCLWWRSWCQFSLANYVTSARICSMQFMFLILPQFVDLR